MVRATYVTTVLYFPFPPAIGSAIQVPDLPTIGSRVSCIGVQCPANSQCQITAGQSACICVTGFQPTRNGCARKCL